MRRAQEGFVNAQRSVILHTAKSNGYFNKEYSPVAAAYGDKKLSNYGSSNLESRCYNC